MLQVKFQYFTDGENVDVLNISRFFLAGVFHEKCLQKIREVWSVLVSISALEFSFFATKDWDINGANSAIPLTLLGNGSGTGYFDSTNLVFGSNNKQVINREELFLFKAGFSNVTSNERTLRSVPITVFSDPLELATQKKLLNELVQTFSQPIQLLRRSKRFISPCF